MNSLFMVFIGGGLGALSRYALGVCLPIPAARFPLATLIANLTAAAILGLLIHLNLKSNDPQKYLLLATGFCGGLSTFSTFSLETVQLLQRGDGWMAVINIALNLIFSLLSIWLIAQHSPALKP